VENHFTCRHLNTSVLVETNITKLFNIKRVLLWIGSGSTNFAPDTVKDTVGDFVSF